MTQHRLRTVTERIGREVTGLNGSVFVHVDIDDQNHIDAVTFSEKSKDGNTLEKVLNALGESVTTIIHTETRA